jgi:uracil permease
MGGILVILFGTIVIVGINSLAQSGEDLLKPRNVIIIAVILILGVGGLSLEAGTFALEGIGVSGLAGVVLNLVLPYRQESRSA